MIGFVIRGEEEAKKWYNGHMNSKEAAEYLGVSKYMIRKLVKEDKIPYTRIYKDVSFHKSILEVWMRGEFIPGRVELILEDDKIDFDHEEALREHYERYPHLRELVETTVIKPNQFSNSEYNFEVCNDGVTLTVGSVNSGVLVQTSLSHTALDNLFNMVQKFRQGLNT